MSALPTIPETINIGKGTMPIMSVDQQKGDIFGARLVKKASPLLVGIVTDAMEWVYETHPNVDAANATATITVTDIGNDGDVIEVFVNDPVYGIISLGTYSKQGSDNTPTILAASITAVLAANSYGYGATSSGAVITITARPGLGAIMDLGNRLIVDITPNPSVIPTVGLWGWYKASDGVTGTTSISGWADQSVAGNNLSQPTTNRQPALYDDVLNGYPVIGLKSISGTQARMTTSGNFPFVDGASVFIVASQNNTGGNADVDGVFYEFSQWSGIFRDFVSASNDYVTLNNDPLAYLTLVNGTYYTLSLLTNGSDLSVYQNGANAGSGTSVSPIVQQPFYIFQNHLNANTGNKRFAEIIVYTRQLTDSERLQVESYLKNKYNHY